METQYFTVNAEGCSIRCKRYARERDEIETVVLFGHGFGGHKDNRAAERFAGRLLEKNRGVAVVTFDFPCHGDDVRKKLRLEDCDAYLRAILAYLNEKYHSPTLYAYATSFGGYLFLKYVSEHGNPFERLAFRCPAVNMHEVLCGVMTEEEKKQIARGKTAQVGFDRKLVVDAPLLESLRDADIRTRDFRPFADRILILHGDRDEVVPYAEGSAFAEKNGILFETSEGTDHRFQNPQHMGHAIEEILAFFDMK